MIGAGRDVKGGVSTVVNQYYEIGLDNQIDLCYIPTMEDGNKVKKVFICIKAYLEFCKKIKSFDIVHVHMSHRASFYRKRLFIKKANRTGKKILIHLHGSEFDVFYKNECNEKQKNEIKRIFDMASVVVVLSEEWQKKAMDFCNPDKLIVLYNAVKIPDFKRFDYDDNNVLFLGRLGNRKGSFDLLKAVPEVLKIVSDAHFYLGGDGEIAQTQEMIRKLGIEKTVSYIGWVTGEEKKDMLKKCSTFVLPSYHEGMPMALLEAMSYGDAVISTTVGGIPKVIQNGYNGLLIEPGDIKGLTDAIIRVLTNDKPFLGQNAFKTIEEKFNAEKNIIILLEIYKEMMS